MNALAPEDANSLERDVDLAIAACGGDARSALRALLIANAFLEAELARATAATSKGYARRGTPQRRAKSGGD
jgi:hypothetical protein